ncbi:MAG: holo-ACP synthase [Chloroflexota bacterium]
MLSTGIDLIEIDRLQEVIERYGERFLQRVFTTGELDDCKENVASLAARFAAKEAASKALGTGIGPVAWRDIEIVRGPERQPLLRLHGAAAARSAALGLQEWSVSLSHTQTLAMAVVVGMG